MVIQTTNGVRQRMFLLERQLKVSIFVHLVPLFPTTPSREKESYVILRKTCADINTTPCESNSTLTFYFYSNLPVSYHNNISIGWNAQRIYEYPDTRRLEINSVKSPVDMM